MTLNSLYSTKTWEICNKTIQHHEINEHINPDWKLNQDLIMRSAAHFKFRIFWYPWSHDLHEGNFQKDLSKGKSALDYINENKIMVSGFPLLIQFYEHQIERILQEELCKLLYLQKKMCNMHFCQCICYFKCFDFGNEFQKLIGSHEVGWHRVETREHSWGDSASIGEGDSVLGLHSVRTSLSIT